jgi:hypothetical protein
MKLLYTIVLLSLVGTGWHIFSIEIGLTGHVKSSVDKRLVKSLTVFVQGDNKFLNKSVTDNKGNFILDFSDNNEKAFDFYCYKKGSDTILLASIKAFESDEPEITFYIPKRINSEEKVVCPTCKRNDKVYKLIYSKPNQKQFTPTRTKYYCARNKMKF